MSILTDEIVRFSINFTTTDEGATLTADKTYSQLSDAVNAENIIDAFLTFSKEGCPSITYALKYDTIEEGTHKFFVLASAEEVINNYKVLYDSTSCSIYRPAGGGGQGGGTPIKKFYTSSREEGKITLSDEDWSMLWGYFDAPNPPRIFVTYRLITGEGEEDFNLFAEEMTVSIDAAGDLGHVDLYLTGKKLSGYCDNYEENLLTITVNE